LSVQAIAVPTEARVSKFSVSGELNAVIEPLFVSADEAGGLPSKSDDETNAAMRPRSKAARRCLKADLNVLDVLKTRLWRWGLIESISCPSFLPARRPVSSGVFL
jgi:hypothetical protein